MNLFPRVSPIIIAGAVSASCGGPSEPEYAPTVTVEIPKAAPVPVIEAEKAEEKPPKTYRYDPRPYQELVRRGIELVLSGKIPGKNSVEDYQELLEVLEEEIGLFHGELTRMLKTETFESIGKKLKEYRQKKTKDGKEGYRVIGACSIDSDVKYCTEMAFEQGQEVKVKYPDEVSLCNMWLFRDRDKWDECNEGIFKKDPQLHLLREMCQYRLLRCVERDFQ